MSFLIVIFVMLILMVLHELGHIVCAFIVRLKIKKAGFSSKPYFHPYVEVEANGNHFQYLLFMLSGISSTLLLFMISWIAGVLSCKQVYMGFALQFLLETNPYYSDFTLLFDSSRKYSVRWYIHFIVWFLLIVFLCNPTYLYGIITSV